MRYFSIMFIFLFMGCGVKEYQLFTNDNPSFISQSQDINISYDSKIVPNDILNIDIYNMNQKSNILKNSNIIGKSNKENNNEYIISEDGTIFLPLLQEVKVIGFTAKELSKKLTTEYMPVYGQGRNLPLQVRLRYLISATAEKTEQAHKLLGKLLFSAMENPEYEVGLEAVDMEVWLAFGVSPRPAFYLSLPMRMERTDRAKLIRMPPELLYQNMRDLDGVLLGPGEIPLPNGRIELADIKLGVNSDSQGHFHFSAIPEKPAKRQFFVNTKGREYEIEATLPKKGELLRLLVMEV